MIIVLKCYDFNITLSNLLVGKALRIFYNKYPIFLRPFFRKNIIALWVHGKTPPKSSWDGLKLTYNISFCSRGGGGGAWFMSITPAWLPKEYSKEISQMVTHPSSCLRSSTGLNISEQSLCTWFCFKIT